MACHIRIASETARFGQPEVNLGLIPGYGGTQRLTQLVGKGRAMELCLTTRMVDAQEALAIGLVNKISTPDNLLQDANNLAQVLLTKSPVAMAAVIQAVNAAVEQNGFDQEIQLFGSCFATEDMREGVSAFLEKRKAVFPGR